MITDKHFIDWESNTFGYGYGTGESYTIPALKDFFELINNGDHNRSYKYDELEKKLTPTVAWLLINTLCRNNVIEYGTSPRFGWLTEKGELLKEYLQTKTADELYDLVNTDESYTHCYPGNCNCEKDCNNLLFKL